MRPAESRISLERALDLMAPGLGAPCCEAQADGVPCAEIGTDCLRCGRGRGALLAWLDEAILEGYLQDDEAWDGTSPPEA